MKKLILVLSLCLPSFFVKAQQLDKRFLDEQIKKRDTAQRFKEKENLYIINGIPFFEEDSAKLDSTLNSYDSKYVVSLEFIMCAGTSIVPCNKPIALVTFAYNLKRKKKRRLWKKVRSAFNDYYVGFSQHIKNDSKDPVLFINNESIHHTEAKKRIDALTLNTIYYIEYTDKPVETETYGQNAKNGLVRIWTVPKSLTNLVPRK